MGGKLEKKLRGVFTSLWQTERAKHICQLNCGPAVTWSKPQHNLAYRFSLRQRLGEITLSACHSIWEGKGIASQGHLRLLSLQQEMMNKKADRKHNTSASLHKLTVAVFSMWRSGQLKLSSTLHFPRRAISFLLAVAQGHNLTSREERNEFLNVKNKVIPENVKQWDAARSRTAAVWTARSRQV